MYLDTYYNIPQHQEISKMTRENERKNTEYKAVNSEASKQGAYLRPQDPDDDSSQLLVLAAELPHLVKARLELPVSRVDAPHHL